jgi:hypothetical protein
MARLADASGDVTMPRARDDTERCDPYGLVTAQWELLHARTDPAGSCKRLMLAVLYENLKALGTGRDADALCWFFMDDEQWPFAFGPVCDALGLSPDRIRRQLTQVRVTGKGLRVRCARAAQKLSHRAVG